VLWGFSISALVAPDDTLAQAAKWQSWVTQNFAWLYIGTQNVWVVLPAVRGVLQVRPSSSWGKREREAPSSTTSPGSPCSSRAASASACTTWGVSEPMYYYRGGALSNLDGRGRFKRRRPRADGDDSPPCFTGAYTGGAPYIVVAVTLGVVCYRWNMPLTMRSAFYPLLGNLIFSPIGDCIDAARHRVHHLRRVHFARPRRRRHHRVRQSASTPTSKPTSTNQTWTIVVMTRRRQRELRHPRVEEGHPDPVHRHVLARSDSALLATLLLDNTWYLLNSYVQSFGHYLNYMIVQAGFRTDAFEQLGLRLLLIAANMFAGTADTDGNGGSPLYDAMAKGQRARDLCQHFGRCGAVFAGSSRMEDYDSADRLRLAQPGNWIMNGWTIFYWGWWVSWAPFVGMFIARISRGRTLRSVIVGSVHRAHASSASSGSCCLGLARHQDAARRRARARRPRRHVDWANGHTNCTSLRVRGRVPGPPNAALALAEDGYYAAVLPREHADKLFDVLQPYGEATEFLWTILCIVGIALYFITSSDSGSYVDDVIAANGLPNPPLVQKVFWCLHRGRASPPRLLKAGGDKSGSTRSAPCRR
jgi:choline-glycine betaine transporter